MTNFAASVGVLSGGLDDAVMDCSVEVLVTRFGISTREKGRSGDPTEETFKAFMSVQPLNQRERKLLPEGTRTEGRVKGYTATEFRTTSTSECKRADHFCYEGQNYVVDKVDNWIDLGGYYRIEATRLGQ